MILGNSAISTPLNSWPNRMDNPPDPKSSIKNLGVWLDSSLAMDHQVNKLSGICFGLFRKIRKILVLIPDHLSKTVIQSLIVSRLDYGNSLDMGSPKYVIKRLQVVQNAAARLLLKVPRYASVRESFKQLHWLPIEARVKFKFLCIALKAIDNKGPVKLRNLVSAYVPNKL